jgi:hypothetical protein
MLNMTVSLLTMLHNEPCPTTTSKLTSSHGLHAVDGATALSLSASAKNANEKSQAGNPHRTREQTQVPQIWMTCLTTCSSMSSTHRGVRMIRTWKTTRFDLHISLEGS